MHYELKRKAIQLRTEGQLSYNAILAQIPVAKSTLHEWLKHYPLSKERMLELRKAAWGKLEVKIELFRETMRQKREHDVLIAYEKHLKKFGKISLQSAFISGLILYLAEGSKTDNYKVSLTNTDPKMIKFFLNWLIKFYKVPKEKIKIFLQLYPMMDIDKEVLFWLNELGFKREQLFKPFIRKLHPSSFSYKESFRHGTCAIVYANTKLKREIMATIRAFLDTAINNFNKGT